MLAQRLQESRSKNDWSEQRKPCLMRGQLHTSIDGDWMTGRVIGQNVLFLHVLASLKDKAALALYTGTVPPPRPQSEESRVGEPAAQSSSRQARLARLVINTANDWLLASTLTDTTQSTCEMRQDIAA